MGSATHRVAMWGGGIPVFTDISCLLSLAKRGPWCLQADIRQLYVHHGLPISQQLAEHGMHAMPVLVTTHRLFGLREQSA